MATPFVTTIGSDLYHRLEVSPLKNLYRYHTDKTISFAGGIPFDSIFPFQKIEVTLNSDSSSFSLDNGSSLALNYMRGDGIPKLREWILNHVKSLHTNTYHFNCCCTIGSTDALTKTIQLISGDSILFEQYAYGSAISAAKALGRKLIGVEIDEQGMLPSSLREQTLLARELGYSPTIVYLVPIAGNPTGYTMGFERKVEIYNVCKELDLCIVEDDAYYYLLYDNPSDENSAQSYDLESRPGLYNLPKSFLSLDVDGRVLRIDSLSKIIAPGMRLGWIAGAQEFISKFQLYQEMSSQFPSGFSQSVFVGLLQHWTDSSLDNHIRKVQLHYKKLRDAMFDNLMFEFQDYYPHRIKFNKPDAGMFIWFEVIDGPESEELFEVLATEAQVITLAGHVFYTPCINGSKVFRKSCLRLTYASTSDELMKEGVKRLADCVKKFM